LEALGWRLHWLLCMRPSFCDPLPQKSTPPAPGAVGAALVVTQGRHKACPYRDMLNNARNKTVVLTVATVVAALAGSFLIVRGAKPQGARSSRRAFIAHGTERHFASKGDTGPVKVTHITFARMGDGSWVEAATIESPQGGAGELISFVDVASARNVDLEPFTKSSMTFYLTPSELQHEVDRAESCPSAISAAPAEHERILGYEVVKLTEEDRAPNNGKEVTEAWVAPELNCYVLRKSASLSDGPHNEIEVTDLTEGEPPPAMFDVPAEYVERSPSQLSAEWAARFGQPFLGRESTVQRLDERYYTHQRR
jgi:hypothetical protein